MHGAGNDFVFISRGQTKTPITKALAQKAGSLSLTLRTLDNVVDQPLDYTSLKDLLQDKSPVPVTAQKQTVIIRRANVVEIVEIK